MSDSKHSEVNVWSWSWFGSKVLPGITATGICFLCLGAIDLKKKIDGISLILSKIEVQEQRLTRIERNSFTVQMAGRVSTALDNAEMKGQGNFATKAVSQVLKQELKLKRDEE